MAVHGYVRLAPSDNSTGTSERYSIVQYAREKNLGPLTALHEDACAAGDPLADRPGGQKLLAELQAGDDVVVRSLYDLAPPGPAGIEQIRQLAARGIRVHVAEVLGGRGFVIDPENADVLLAFAGMLPGREEAVSGVR